MKEKIDEEDEERKHLRNHTQNVSTYVNKRRKGHKEKEDAFLYKRKIISCRQVTESSTCDMKQSYQQGIF